MKITLTTLLSYMLTLCCLTAAAETNYKDNSAIDAQWRKTEIKVKGGSKAPSIMTLLKAFHSVMPTWSVEQVIKHGSQTTDGQQYQDADDWHVLVNRRQGYAELSSQTDIDQVTACLWRKKDGSRFFAVSLYQQHSTPSNILCWYEYNPKTETMVPKESPVDDFLDVQTDEYRKRAIAAGELSWALPMSGTDFMLYENIGSLPTIAHVHKWNGMQFMRTEIRVSDFTFRWFGSGEPAKASSQGFNSYSLLNLSADGSPVLLLRKTQEGTYGYGTTYTMFSSFKGENVVVATNNGLYNMEGIYHPKVMEGKPWKTTDAVTVTRDATNNTIYAVISDGLVSYYVWAPTDDINGTRRRVIGYGGNDETIDITLSEPSEAIPVDSRWFPCVIVPNK